MKTGMLSYRSILIFLVLTHLFYYPTWNAGFVTDFTGLVSRLEGSSILGVLDCFGFPALEQLLNLCYYLIFSVSGTQPILWYLIFTSFHVLNASLLFSLVKRTSLTFNFQNATTTAWIAALFFLLSPYQSEVLVWRVCLNFLMVSFLVLVTVWKLLDWLETNKRSHLIAVLGLTLTAFFVFELALMLPILSLLVVLFYYRYSDFSISLKRSLIQLSLPQFSFVGLYFLLNKLILGVWIGHYGPAVHLKFDIPEMIATSLKYMVKMAGFVRYYPHTLKEKIFGLINNEVVWLPYLIGLLVVGVIVFLIKKRTHKKFAMLSLLLFLCLFALAPILNLYFNFLLHIENDRYGYMASLFFYWIIALKLSYLPKYLQIGFAGIYLCISAFFLIQTNQFWANSTKVYYSLLDNFTWHDAPEVYLLNLPDNLKGAPMFRDYSKSEQAFHSPMKYLKKKEIKGRIHEVVQYNMTDSSNGVSVMQDSSQIKVEFKQWGNWWWRRGQGATGLENESYQFSNQGHHYMLLPKAISPGAIFLYQDSLEWKQFNWDSEESDITSKPVPN